MNSEEFALKIILPFIIAAIVLGVGIMLVQEQRQKLVECNLSCGRGYKGKVNESGCHCVEAEVDAAYSILQGGPMYDGR